MFWLAHCYIILFTVVVCARLRDPANGMVSVSGNDFESKARYRCNPGYLLVGDETRACEANGYWSGQEPVCRCMILIILVDTF